MLLAAALGRGRRALLAWNIRGCGAVKLLVLAVDAMHGRKGTVAERPATDLASGLWQPQRVPQRHVLAQRPRGPGGVVP